jgi:glycosyltransferase involved in cell wall biosynthesis
VHVKDVARALISDGHDVRVFVGGGGLYLEKLKELGLNVTCLDSLKRRAGAWSDVKAIIELRDTLRRYNPDLVSTHSSKAGTLGRLACKLLGIPVIFTAHGWSFSPGVPQPGRTLYAGIERLLGRLSDLIIAVSDYDKSLAIRHGIASPPRLIRVHNGIEDVHTRFLAIPEKYPPRIIMTARFDKQKDHRTLLQAAAMLESEEYTLELLGDGPLKPQARSMVSALGIDPKVSFRGLEPNVAERLSRAQIFALISNWEGFPLSVLEAMRAGMPVVATDVGGVSEAVVDGVSGFLCPVRDPSILQQRLQALVQDPALRGKMGEAGRSLYKQWFTFERSFGSTLDAYREVLRETPGRHA